MALNKYELAVVKVLISNEKHDLLGDNTLQALCEIYYAGKLDIFSVSQVLKDVLKEGDLVLVDEGLVNIPKTDKTAPRNEIIKIIRDETKGRIENIYKDLLKKSVQEPKSPTVA